MAKVKKLDEIIADEWLIIRRRLVSFRADISRLADESFRLIFVKQLAQVLGLANLHLCLLSAAWDWNYSSASLEILVWNNTKLWFVVSFSFAWFHLAFYPAVFWCRFWDFSRRCVWNKLFLSWTISFGKQIQNNWWRPMGSCDDDAFGE